MGVRGGRVMSEADDVPTIDVVCPWRHIGEKRLEAALADAGEELRHDEWI
jgi:hypothetical protein